MIFVDIHCHCQLTSFSVSLPSSSFPLKSALCHCSSCRHTTGQLFATWAVIPTPIPTDLLGSGNLGKYESSSSCERWFCARCGASVINIDKTGEQPEWETATGLLHFKDGSGLEGKLDRVQLWVEDVKSDAGAVGWINRGQLSGMDRRWNGRQSGIVSDEDVREMMETGRTVPPESQGDRLLARCHCQTVTFSISRPERSFNNGTGKFEACLDACTSCRTVTGFEVTAWATIPKPLIRVEGSGVETLFADKARLGQYQTSADVKRYFCIKCGATVIYEKHGDDAVTVGVGLLEPSTRGKVRIEDWLTWQPYPYPECLAYAEDAVDKHFIRNLVQGMREAELTQ